MADLNRDGIPDTLDLLKDSRIDWDQLVKNKKKLAKINRTGRKSYVFHIGLFILLSFIIVGFLGIADIVKGLDLVGFGTWALMILGGYSGIATIFLAAVYKDKTIGQDGSSNLPVKR